MSDRIQQAFDIIRAEEGLKEQTLQHIYDRAIFASKPRKKHPVRRLAVALASVFVFASAAGVSYRIYASPAAFVDVDVNPSIELTINRFDRVIGVYAYNEDGEQVLSDVRLKNKTTQEAMDQLLLTIEKLGYMKDSSLLSITVQSDSQQQKLLESLQMYVNSAVSNRDAQINQEIFAVDAQTKEHSHSYNVSPAQYLAIQELKKIDPTVSVEECQEHTITEIREITGEHGKSHHMTGDTENDTNRGGNNASGQKTNGDEDNESGQETGSNPDNESGHESKHENENDTGQHHGSHSGQD